ncbi:MAG: hypothetical protein WBE26_08465 [Phycisphaerae bacterium]
MANPTMPLLSESAAEALGGTTNVGTGIKHEASAIDHQTTPTAFSQFKNHQHGVFTLLAAADWSELTIAGGAGHWPDGQQRRR